MTPDAGEAGATFQHRLEVAAYRATTGILSRLPAFARAAVAWVVGGVAGSVLRIRRRVVDENLARAFPDRDARWRNRVAVASYRHLVRETLEGSRMARKGSNAVLELTRYDGWDALWEAHEGGRGLIIASGHLGNWELGGAAIMAKGVPVTAVAARLRNPLFNQYIVESRRGLGPEIVFRDEGTRPLVSALGEGHALGLVADQNKPKGGVFVEFFGVPASAAAGPAALALRLDVPLFLGVYLKDPDPSLGTQYRLLFYPVDTRVEGDADPVPVVAQRYHDILEALIREYPEQYFWLHRRWKTQPSEGS